MKSMTNNRGSVLMIIGAVLIIAALSFVVYNRISDSGASKECQEALEQLMDTVPEVRENALGNFHTVDGNMPTAEISGKDYCGVLEIPALDVKLPILAKGGDGLPGRYTGSAYTKDLILFGKNSTSLFGRIDLLKAGAEIKFMDVDGNLFTYRALDMEILRKSDEDALYKGEWDLTIFTANWSGNKLKTIRCIYG